MKNGNISSILFFILFTVVVGGVAMHAIGYFDQTAVPDRPNGITTVDIYSNGTNYIIGHIDTSGEIIDGTTQSLRVEVVK